MTDLAPDAGEAGWYGLRAWIEQGCKLTKRAGGQWHRTRMTDPVRAARLWLAVAVATLWLVSIGGAVDATIPEATLPDVTALCPAYRRPRRATRWRLMSVFRRGWLTLIGALLRHDAWPEGRFVPEPWPALRCLDEARGPEEVPTRPEAAYGDQQREKRRCYTERIRTHSTYCYKKSTLMSPLPQGGEGTDVAGFRNT